MAFTDYEAIVAQRRRRRTFWFYFIYFLVLAGLCFGLKLGLDWLEGWLTDYEAAQPKTRCQEIFEDLFSQPDWAELYTLAGMEGTRYETPEAFAEYMEQKSQGQTLSYYETSAGLSGDHKYIVKLGSQKVAIFTLTNENPQEETPRWELGTVELFPEFSASITVCTAPNRTVFVNGVELTQEHVQKTLSTAAEDYLPQGLHGLQRQWQYVDGLLLTPQVTALDSDGNPVELVYDEATNTYTEIFPEMEITEKQTDTAVKAAKTYCRYMIGAASRSDLRGCFDSSTDIYSSIVASDTWMQNYKDYNFSDYTLSGYHSYSSRLYSVTVTMTLNVVRNNNTVKEYPLDTTFFLEKLSDGSWKVVEMTNVDAQEQTVLVRLTFKVGQEVLQSQMTDASAGILSLPEVQPPEGMEFIGWYRQKTDSAGNVTYSLTFMPDENGQVYLPAETVLEPMTLYALFDTKEAE